MNHEQALELMERKGEEITKEETIEFMQHFEKCQECKKLFGDNAKWVKKLFNELIVKNRKPLIHAQCDKLKISSQKEKPTKH